MARPRKPRRPQPTAPSGEFLPTITGEVVQQIVLAVQAGVTFQGAAGYAGVPVRTFYRWLQDGRRYPDEYPLQAELVAGLDQALGQFEATAMTGIRQAAAGNWQAWAWMLERRFPDRYSRMLKQDVSITASSDDPRIVALHEAGFEGDPGLLTEDELEQLIDLMHKAIPQERRTVEARGGSLPLIEQGGGSNGRAAP